MTPAGAPVLELTDVVVVHRARGSRRGPAVRAVDGVSLTVGAGEIVALVGESGCGKTTLADVAMRLVDVTSGAVRFAGEDVTALRGPALRALRRRFQMIFQDPYESLDPRRTVGDTVLESLRVNHLGAGAPQRRRRALDALEQAGLTPAADLAARYPHQLSGGQRQRVAVAAAMVVEPELVVADEPVSMLDVSLRAGILALMRRLRTERGVAFLFITHDLAVAATLADRIAVVYLGRVVEQGPAAAVIGTPRHPYTRALVSVSPSVTGPAPDRTVLTGEAPDASRIPPGCRFHPRCPRYRALGRPAPCRERDPVLGDPVLGDPVLGDPVLGDPRSGAPAPHRAACHYPTTAPTPDDRPDLLAKETR